MTLGFDLALRLMQYEETARVQEEERTSLIEELSKLAKAEILPKIQEHLDSGLSIDVEKSRIRNYYEGSPHEKVPNGFQLSVRLLYDGKPIYNGFAKDAMESVKASTWLSTSELENISREYQLKDIELEGEPETIG